MKRRAIALLCGLIMARAAGAATASLESATQPLAEGVPQVAIVRLEQLLATTALAPDARRAATLKLAEAYIAAGRADAALKTLDGSALASGPDLVFLRAQTFAALRRWADALPLFQAAAADAATPFRGDALFGAAECQRALGKRDDAIATLAALHQVGSWAVRADLRAVSLHLEKNDPAAAARLLDGVQAKSASERKEKRLLRGRTEAALGRTDKAIELYSTILKKPQGATHEILLSVLFDIADLQLRAKNPEGGDDYVEEYIERHPADSDLPLVFAKLDQLYAAERKPARRELVRWASDRSQPRRALAQWYLTRLDLRAGRRDIASQTFAELRANHPQFPPLAGAYLEFAQLALDDRRFDEATALLNEARTLNPPQPVLERINMLGGEAQYRAGQWAAAAETFETATAAGSRHSVDGEFNAALSRLLARDTARFITDADEVAARGGTTNDRGELLLEQGLVQAAQGDKRAPDALQAFAKEFPKHPRVAEAWVALAEIAFHGSPPRVRDAEKFLGRAAESQPNAAAVERADYLRIWMADAAPDPNAPGVIALANDFLRKHPDSKFVPDTRMKLAEAYFRRQDFASAQTQFELLAQHDPNGPLAEKAQFFAAESALQSMGSQSLDRSLTLLSEVVKRNGELRWAARNEQAAVERKLGKPQDALALYDEVLNGDAKPGEKREALCGKADVIYEMGTADREKYKAALELYRQLAAQPNVPFHWRNQALFKAGTCLEKLEDRPGALETFYRVIEDDSRPDRPPEYFWFYKAGFNAARILEEQEQWAPAATVYQKLALAGGDRSDEAKSRLGRLRLEHFLWEQ